MEFSTYQKAPASCDYPCVVAGVYADHKLPKSTADLDKACSGAIKRRLKEGDLGDARSSILTLFDVDGAQSARIMLVNLGKASSLNKIALRKATGAVYSALKRMKISKALISYTDMDVVDADPAARAQAIAERLISATYRYTETKSDSSKSKEVGHISLYSNGKRHNSQNESGIKVGQAIGHGRHLARDLGNLPGNICTPTYLADQARKLAKSSKQLKVTVFNQDRIEKLGMRTFLSVSKGSREEPKLIQMEYSGGRKTQAPIVLVGKGITFDSGGISIKPAGTMDEMKFDMCGAASVFGTMQAVVALGLKLNVICLVPACENLPDGAANKPGDIIESMAGLTVEILNTDAEGRLILCDALTYVERFKPKAVVDIATLTGACVIALGAHASGLFSNDQKLADTLLGAGEKSMDRAWQMPMWDEYQRQLDSNFADIANVGGRAAGSVTAACFLSRFAKKYPWAHLDIAGVAWRGGSNKGSTGRPVPMLTQYLIDQAR